MRNDLTIFCLLLFSAFLMNSVLTNYQASDAIISHEIQTTLQTAIAYVNHGPITIASDSDFSSQGWPGSGTKGDPYRIENLNITGTGDCINIQDTRAYFIIQNCLLNSMDKSSSSGIYMDNATNSRIYSNIFTQNYRGLYVLHSPNMTIEGNVFYDNVYGIFFTQESYCNITDNSFGAHDEAPIRIGFSNDLQVAENTIEPGSKYGIYAIFSSNTIIESNIITEATDYGMSLQYLYYSEIRNNTIIGLNRADGIKIFSSSFNSISDNNLTYCGFDIYASDTGDWAHTFQNNLVNGKKLGYFFNASGLTIDASEYGQLLIGNSSELIIFNAEIENLSIGVRVQFSTRITLSNIFVNNCRNAIEVEYANLTVIDNSRFYSSADDSNLFIENSSNLTISNSEVRGSYYAAWLRSSENITLLNNTFSETTGVGIQGDALQDIQVLNNTITDSDYALWLLGGNITISFNKIISNNVGARITGSGFGEFTNNLLSANQEYGLYLYGVTNSSILNNTIQLTEGIGIYSAGSSGNNSIWGNAILSNVINAVDNSSDNMWDNAIDTGNEWDDYNGTGYYQISGTARAVDHYPIKGLDIRPPTLWHSYNPAIGYKSTGNTLKWYAYDKFPSHYELYIDGLLKESGSWNGSDIIVSIDNLNLGQHQLTMVVFDTSNNNASDDAIVDVYQVDYDAPTLNHPPDIEYYYGETGHNITWSPTDEHNISINVFKDSELIYSDHGANVSVIIDVDGLPLGTHNYTIVVQDYYDNAAKDTVFVTVLEYSNDTTTSTSTQTSTSTTIPSNGSGNLSLPDPAIMAIILLIGMVSVIVLLVSRRHR